MYYEGKRINNIKLDSKTLENMEFFDCTFENCTLENCLIDRCIFAECKFIHCNVVSIQSKYSQIKYAEFEKCNLIGVHWNELLSAGRIADPIRKVKHTILKYNTFMGMKFIRFDFSKNVMQDSMFEECDLRECSFKGNVLERTQFLNCDLRKADLREATEYQIDIQTNKLKGARFSFPEVIALLKVLEIKIE